MTKTSKNTKLSKNATKLLNSPGYICFQRIDFMQKIIVSTICNRENLMKCISFLLLMWYNMKMICKF